jgi:hypothetical protein
MAHQTRLTRHENVPVHFLTITDTIEMTDDATFHNCTVQRANFRLIHSHYDITELLRIAQLRKNSASTKSTEDVTVRLQRARILQKQPRPYSKALRQQKRRQQLRKKDFLYHQRT